jgi:glycosyltransferase involved in cell wall biosynthesis
MACGTPVVACGVGALPEVMRLAGGGPLVAADDPAALAQGIRELLENPERRTQISQQARARVEATFSWSRVAKTTVGVYREAIAERRGRPTSTITSASRGHDRATPSTA